MKQIFTHYAWFYGIPCYFNYKTGAFDVRHDIFKWLFDLAVRFHDLTSVHPPYFSINVGDAL